ncbi:MarR family winged helix-turn-helix transcriptional regulator [Enterobacter kobei]|jgi:DNA-binding MarR family transcriptional regulator|uniref:MarR family winged helix-turn-helix transcriptional regulator n=1 Tax=Enterobacter kobei TaxID=208224 RepID=UPI000642AD17|nr:MarR family transcriptional regulator [Enterobacter kobei]EMC7917974.1 MarR family transcriptional regulator [Enterobacter kobei]KLR27753.1 MarR family transcriptional regulator [Enterobacter kobei]MCH4290406.1 MarR family transcriptional regulator [Enterobacter kobei]MCK6889758.1 MarR family transcriptional regulator [Enterobacter kobei]HDT5934144.1 MarR family transcriptional regulator [Enterobacter kobei]
MTKHTNSEDSLPDVHGMLCFSLYSAGHAFTQLYRPMLDKLGLTYPQYLVMVTLWNQDGRTVKELSGILFLESSTLTPLLKRLETAGLITRTRNPKDEREVLIHLTEKGEALKSETSTITRCIVDTLGMDADIIADIKASVDKIRDKIHRAQKPDTNDLA